MQSLSVTGGKIWTGKRDEEWAEALLIRGSRIVALGSNSDIRRHELYGRSRKIELAGETVLPGLSDCHLHLQAYAKQRTAVDLNGVTSTKELLARLRAQAESSAPGSWICGFGYDESRFLDGAKPDGRLLDSLGEQPILIQRICTHESVMNAKAMQASGLALSDAAGVLRDENGRTGVVVEESQEAAHAAAARSLFTPEIIRTQVARALEEASSYGLSTLYTCGATTLGMEETLNHYQELRAQGQLKARIFSYHDTAPPYGMGSGFGDNWIGYQGCKLFLDGSLGARTAALSQPYSDSPLERGVLLHETDELVGILNDLAQANCQALIHAIGDGALDQLIEAMRRVAGQPMRQARPGVLVNHCMICRPDQMAALADMGVGATVQPTFLTSDRHMAPLRLGTRIDSGHAYPWRSLIDAGVTLSGSSDCPIESLNPWRAISAAVNRALPGEEPWMPEECLTLDEALRLYTVNPAINSGSIAWRGTIEAGKEADITILDRDIFNCPANELGETRSAVTLVGGVITHGGALLEQAPVN